MAPASVVPMRSGVEVMWNSFAQSVAYRNRLCEAGGMTPQETLEAVREALHGHPDWRTERGLLSHISYDDLAALERQRDLDDIWSQEAVAVYVEVMRREAGK
jgi:hypothetical protein